jgi:succinate dehydrogenase / fumarate reductase flavoprotein subunit
VPKQKGDKRSPDQIPESERDYYLERKYPSFGNLAPRDISSRAAKEACDEGRGVGESGRGVFLDFNQAIQRLGIDTIRTRYGNLFDMYAHITNEDPYRTPMRIYPAVHYCMGGLWVDYDLMSNLPGLFVLGEANFSDHGANRLGASALMQGLADGYFIAPYSIGNFLAGKAPAGRATDHEAFKSCERETADRLKRLLAIKGKKSVMSFHRRLGKTMWDFVGMSRSETSLNKALGEIPAIREEFWQHVSVPGGGDGMNQALDSASRVADFLEFAELLAYDALDRKESCGAHFREEYQEDGECKRNDDDYAYVAAWEYKGDGKRPELHKEELSFEDVHLAVRSYK